MAYIESYQCDVCGDKKGEGGDWWLAWVDCFQGEKPEEDQPLIKLLLRELRLQAKDKAES